MEEYIKKDDALAFPFANGQYDHENADEHFIFGCETYKEWLEQIPAADVRPVVQRDAVMQALNKYFSIGDSDTYELTRANEAFYVGTMTLDDFEEWNEDNVSDLCDYLMKELFGPNCVADMR